MPVKLTVILYKRSPFLWGQHIAAIAEDMETGEKYTIDYNGSTCSWVSTADQYYVVKRNKLPTGSTNCYVFLPKEKELVFMDNKSQSQKVAITNSEELEKKLDTDRIYTQPKLYDLFSLEPGKRLPTSRIINKGSKTEIERDSKGACWCCTGVATLYSNKNFNMFVASMEKRFAEEAEYCILTKNCADAVSYAIDELCPDKTKINVAFWCYQAFFCSLAIGTVGLCCFPGPPFTCLAPNDVLDKARLLQFCSPYGNPDIVELNQPLLAPGPKRSIMQ